MSSNWTLVNKKKPVRSSGTKKREQKFANRPYIEGANVRHGKVPKFRPETGNLYFVPSPAKFHPNQKKQQQFFAQKMGSLSPSQIANYMEGLNTERKLREAFKHGNTKGQRIALKKVLNELQFANEQMRMKMLRRLNTPPTNQLRKPKTKSRITQGVSSAARTLF